MITMETLQAALTIRIPNVTILFLQPAKAHGVPGWLITPVWAARSKLLRPRDTLSAVNADAMKHLCADAVRVKRVRNELGQPTRGEALRNPYYSGVVPVRYARLRGPDTVYLDSRLADLVDGYYLYSEFGKTREPVYAFTKRGKLTAMMMPLACDPEEFVVAKGATK